MADQAFISGVQGSLYFIDGVKNGGVILSEFFTDICGGQVGMLPDQIDGHLTGFHRALAALGTTQSGFIDGVEFAYLIDDQAGGGQGVTLVLEHIINGSGNVGQIHGHIVQIPVSQDLFHRAFDLTDIAGNIVGNLVANIVRQLQSKGNGLIFNDRHSGFIVRRLHIGQQAPFKAAS